MELKTQKIRNAIKKNGRKNPGYKRPVYIGAGLRSQINSSNRSFFTPLTSDHLNKVLKELGKRPKRKKKNGIRQQ